MFDAAPTPISRKLRAAIEDEIVAGALLPGERLDETALAARFAVSRTPVREALNQLATSGLVEIRPRRGAIVASLTPERLYEMFEVMAELEAMAGRLAARRVSAAEIEALADAHAACGANRDDSDRYYAANETFHQAIYAASGNAFLAEQCRALQRRLRPYRRLQLRVRGRLATSFAEHEAIVAAIRTGEGEQVAELLRAHIRVQGERFSDLVAGLARLGAA
ncbi:GntR family transcriptional regulator [Rhabdaerophilum calidifontis]|uniref:GntR family transcriptional regulator n=1 Tax=Rhabdaerophilum calidifontis TaxID=2604328 RepID=UPI0012396CD6|nr:GntR family transcriptional regulator [Rhabdaerophilum calidifontis]